MFETSASLFFQWLLYNILLPIIPWIFFLRLFFGKKIKGLLLYILWRFLGVWVVAFSLFNLQFIHFWIGVWEYFWILWLIIILFIGKFIYKKEKLSDYISTLEIKSPIDQIKQSFISLSKTEKIFTIVSSIFTLIFLIVSFVHVNKFPTYADDSFWNRHRPVMNIIQDGWVKLFWAEDEILARWRLWYPIYIPIYKALVSDFMWWFNDIYINIRQRFILFWLLLFSTYFTRNKTKNIFYTVLPSALICALPLVYFHAVEWYMELASVTYAILMIWWLYEYIKSDYKNYHFVILSIICWWILSNIKNDWIVVYLPWIIIAFLLILVLDKKVNLFFKQLVQKNSIIWFILSLIYFYIPFLFVKLYYWLWFNQAAWEASWMWISQTVHREIFNVIPSLFTKADNYNTILLLIIFAWYLYFTKLGKKEKFLIMTPLFILIILILVFLLTENYVFALNQTTINRVFTTTFIILLFFIPYLIGSKHEETN